MTVTSGENRGGGLTGPLQRHLEAFSRLSQVDQILLNELVGNNVRRIAARRDVIREGDRPRGVIAILDGWACSYKQLPDGRRQIVYFLVPGDLGDANAFILERMDHSIGALTDLTYAEIPPAEFEAAMAQSPTIARAVWWHELVTAAIQREWTTNVGQRTAYERLSHLLCEMFVKLEAVGLAAEGSCPWPLTQSDLADATGLTAVHVNRTLQELRREGLISLQGRRLTIPDFAALAKAGGFNRAYLHLSREAA